MCRKMKLQLDSALQQDQAAESLRLQAEKTINFCQPEVAAAWRQCQKALVDQTTGSSRH